MDRGEGTGVDRGVNRLVCSQATRRQFELLVHLLSAMGDSTVSFGSLPGCYFSAFLVHLAAENGVVEKAEFVLDPCDRV
jgi:hypothetical protein